MAIKTKCLSHGLPMEFDYRSGYNLCPKCEEDTVPAEELLALSKQEGWERALTEYRQLREEIGRLEESGECACEDFHTCQLCTETTALDQRARTLMTSWGDSWAMQLALGTVERKG